MSSEDKFGPKLNLTIVYCNSEDESFPVSELQRHTEGTNGWQSAKQCEYPVELGFRFDGDVRLDFLRLLCHESKISSKLEVFIAEATEDDRRSQSFPPYDKAVFRRLGHIKFSTNEEKYYEARELKTVNVNRSVIYLKLLLRQCHSNSINVFNQVGLIALTVHGELVTPFARPEKQNGASDSLELLMEAQGSADDVPLDQMTPMKPGGGQGQIASSDNVEPDPTVDAITAKKIRELTIHKARAVSEEDYDLAKALKQMIDQLREVGARILVLDQKKVEAVEAEDYDEAKRLKQEIDSLRNNAMKRPSAPARPAPPEEAPIRPPPQQEPTYASEPSPTYTADEPPAPAPPQEESHVVEAAPAPVSYDERPAVAANPPASNAAMAYDDRPAVAQTPVALDEMIKQGDTGGIVVAKPPAATSNAKQAAVESDAMSQWERELNSLVVSLSNNQPPADALAAPKLAEYKEFISTFGTYVTSCFFSKRWQLREAAVSAIVSNEGFAILTKTKGIPGSSVCTALLNYLGSKGHGVQDTISQVFFSACDALKRMVAEELSGVSASSLSSTISSLLPDLMLKAGDNNQRIREQASSLLLLIASSSLGPERVSHAAVSEPESAGKKQHSFRVHVARVNMVTALLDRVGLQKKDARTGLTVDGIMTKLCLPCLQHSHQDAREGAMDLIVKLCEMTNQSQVTPHLANVKPAQRALIDEQLAKGGAGGGGGGLAAPSKGDQEMASSSFSVDANGKNPVLSAAREAKKQQAAASKPSPKKGKVDESKVCQFCGKYDKRFNENTLDIHYVRTCPMLCPCPLCGQVTEISSLQDHLINECDRRSLVKKCPICCEAIRAEELEAHVAAKACIPANPAKYSVCPLCHAKLPPGEKGWMQHLLQAPGCKHNPRAWDGGNGEEFK